MAMFDDPRFVGGRSAPVSPLDEGTATSSSSSDPSDGQDGPLDLRAAYSASLPVLDPEHADLVSAILFPANGDQARAVFERVVSRLAVVLTFVAATTTSTLVDGPARLQPLPRRSDFERYVLSFPALCLSPLMPLIFRTDSRALVMLYHLYHASRVLLGTEESWWSVWRSVVMERLLKAELEMRGIDVCLRYPYGGGCAEADAV